MEVSTIPCSKSLLSNYFPMSFNANIYKFQISTIPDYKSDDKQLSTLNKEIAKYICDSLPFKVFYLRYPNIYTPYPFDIKNLKLTVEGEEKVINFQLSGILEQNDPELSNLIGRIIKIIQKKLGFIEINKKFFNPKNLIEINNHRLSILPGFLTSLKRFENFSLNIDSVYKVLQQETVLERIYELKSQNKDYRNIKHSLIGVLIVSKYNNLVYKIEDIDNEVFPNSYFKVRDGSQITFNEYYQKKYGRKILDQNQNLLKVRLLKNKNETSSIYLVPELCVLSGLTDIQRNNNGLMREVAYHLKKNPEQKLNMLIDHSKALNKTIFEDNSLKHWSLKISSNPLAINGKIQSPFLLLQGKNRYDQNYSVRIDNHSIQREIQKPPYEKSAIRVWGILYTSSCRNELNTFGQKMEKFVNELYEKPFSDFPPKIIEVQRNQWEQALSNVPANCDFLVCLLSSEEKNRVYSQVKKELTLRRGIPTQVILNRTLQRGNIDSIIANIIHQIISKCGGVPWIAENLPFSNEREPTIIFGIDVYHEKKADRKSVYALVASQNLSFTKFWSKIYFQEQGVDIGTQIQNGISEALQIFRSFQNVFPKNLIVFRDGLNIAEINAIKEFEIKSIERAIENVTKESKEKIRIIYICVNKICSLKLFLVDDLKKKVENPMQGTTINSFDNQYDKFYLVSQKTNQGTVTPTQYLVVRNDLWDENSTTNHKEMILELLKSLSYKLCFQYFNWVGGIKIPAPVLLAHKLAEFVGKYLDQASNLNPVLGMKRSSYFI